MARGTIIGCQFHPEKSQAVGLRSLSAQSTSGPAKAIKTASAAFKQYRESDGQFYFKLVDTQGKVLLQSLGFTSPKDAGLAIGQLQQHTQTAITELGAQVVLGQGVDMATLLASIEALVSEMTEKAKSKG